jgi:hypothetical protein
MSIKHDAEGYEMDSCYPGQKTNAGFRAWYRVNIPDNSGYKMPKEQSLAIQARDIKLNRLVEIPLYTAMGIGFFLYILGPWISLALIATGIVK